MDEHKTRQRDHFDAAAGTMPETLPLRDNLMALHQVRYNRCVRRLPLRQGDRVLEVGFGWVQLIRVLAGEADFQGVGMDLSFSMVAAAHRERGRMTFLVGDAEKLPFASESFDSIIALSLLEHVPCQERALQEMHRVLKPGGRLLMQFPVKDDFLSWQFFYRSFFPERYRLLLQRLAHEPALIPHSVEFRQLLSQIGFSSIWESRDEVFFQPLYDYYVLSFLDRLKQWKDGNRSGAVAIGRSCTADQTAGPNITMPRGPWRPKPAGIHRILLPLASLLLIPDYLLGKCGIGACLWTLSHKK